MSRKLGKSKNWGSRTGKSITDKSTSNSLSEKLWKAGLSEDLLKAIEGSNSEISITASEILNFRSKLISGNDAKSNIVFATDLGHLYKGDCIKVLQAIQDDSIDCVFADPPFNLSKDYSNGVNDLVPGAEYLEWTRVWLDLCIQKLKPGGSLFIYNIPKWSIPIAEYLSRSLTFRNWIAIDITLSMPIPGRLFPSHYSLLYFIKGDRPNVFRPQRIPIKTCPKCGKEQNDYGGYKKKMNSNGVNIRDVWTDIPPVRHSKFKNRDANELHIKLLNRVLDMATNEGDLVFDPFGGSGTTFVAAELKNRRWIGSELGPCEPIIERFDELEKDQLLLKKTEKETNILFTDDALKLRAKSGLPIDSFNIYKSQVIRALGHKYLELNPKLDLLDKED